MRIVLMNHKKRKESIAFIVFAVALIAVVLAFTGALIIFSFQQNYLNSLVTSYYVNGNDVMRKIEYSLRYGKSLENFYGIESVLGEKHQQNAAIDRIFIISADGTILYDHNGKVYNEFLPSSLRTAIKEKATIEVPYIYEKYHDDYYLFFSYF